MRPRDLAEVEIGGKTVAGTVDKSLDAARSVAAFVANVGCWYRGGFRTVSPDVAAMLVRGPPSAMQGASEADCLSSAFAVPGGDAWDVPLGLPCDRGVGCAGVVSVADGEGNGSADAAVLLGGGRDGTQSAVFDLEAGVGDVRVLGLDAVARGGACVVVALVVAGSVRATERVLAAAEPVEDGLGHGDGTRRVG